MMPKDLTSVVVDRWPAPQPKAMDWSRRHSATSSRDDPGKGGDSNGRFADDEGTGLCRQLTQRLVQPDGAPCGRGAAARRHDACELRHSPRSRPTTKTSARADS